MKNTKKWNEYYGIRLKYTNPLNGGHAIPTMATFIQLLPKKFNGKYYRSTEGIVFCVVEGKGSTMIENNEYLWNQGDIFVIPSWSKYKHITNQESVLFSFSDRPIQEMLGLFREEFIK